MNIKMSDEEIKSKILEYEKVANSFAPPAVRGHARLMTGVMRELLEHRQRERNDLDILKDILSN